VREYAAAAYGAFIALVHEREQQAEDDYYREAVQEVIFRFFFMAIDGLFEILRVCPVGLCSCEVEVLATTYTVALSLSYV